ncbi:MAG: hypothetical protein Q9192_002906 [Flavoplaca navasiana]
MTDSNLQGIHDFLVGLAQKAGPKIVSANPSAVDTKKNYPSSLVSNSFLGEETSTSGRLSASPTFVVDPIDGTTNFVHAHPYISISMAFVQDFKPEVGVVYNPFTQHLYTAIRGQGAYLTAPKIPTSFPTAGQSVDSTYEKRKLPLRSPPLPLTDLSSALVAVEYGNERSGNNWETKIGTFNALGRARTEKDGAMVQSVRSLGSAALNCCSVARGDIDVYWEGGCWAWDVAAGWIIVEEAGGMVVGGNSGEWEPKVDGRRYLVLRAGAGKKVVEEFWSKTQVSFLYFSTAYPTSNPPDEVKASSSIQYLHARNAPQSARNKLTPSKQLHPRLTPPGNPDDPFRLPDDISSLLDIAASPPRTQYHFTLTSYQSFLTNTSNPNSYTTASAALTPFYTSTASLIAYLTRQNKEKVKAIGFGGKRFWLNFYAEGDDGVLEWKDLAWCVERWVEIVKRGLVGRWRGVMWPPGTGKGVRVELRLLERLRGER